MPTMRATSTRCRRSSAGPTATAEALALTSSHSKALHPGFLALPVCPPSVLSSLARRRFSRSDLVALRLRLLPTNPNRLRPVHWCQERHAYCHLRPTQVAFLSVLASNQI